MQVSNYIHCIYELLFKPFFFFLSSPNLAVMRIRSFFSFPSIFSLNARVMRIFKGNVGHFTCLIFSSHSLLRPFSFLYLPVYMKNLAEKLFPMTIPFSKTINSKVSVISESARKKEKENYESSFHASN